MDKASISTQENSSSTELNAECLWPDGKIYYKIIPFATPLLFEKLQLAIKGWNDILAPVCEYQEVDTNTSGVHCVTFEEISDGNPIAIAGYKPGNEQSIKLPAIYSNGKPLTIECILHEMLHCAGFQHEQLTEGKNPHCLVENRELPMTIAQDTGCIPMGKIDFYSLIRYGPGFAKAKDFLAPTFNKHTISAADRAIIRTFYGNQGTHHGDWHQPCCSDACTDQICLCDSCGRLPGGVRGGVNCGYVGLSGHWSCCMSEIKESKCKTTHGGYWHAKCVGSKCSQEGCVCYNCGGGCPYEGSTGHWNCCSQETFDSVCNSDTVFAKLKLKKL